MIKRHVLKTISGLTLILLGIQACAGASKTPQAESKASEAKTSDVGAKAVVAEAMFPAGNKIKLGPVAMKDVPKEILAPCLDSNKLIADKNGRWNPGDVVEPGVPTTRFTSACKHSATDWSIKCEWGGFAVRQMQAQMKFEAGSWIEAKREYAASISKLTCP